MESLRERAAEVLRTNDRGSYTVPSGRLYPHQWAWDSAFIAMGWAHLDPDRALSELESLTLSQWDDGRIAHIRFDPGSSGYFPDPGFWMTPGRAPVPSGFETSSITQPPVWAIAARKLCEAGGDRRRLGDLVESFEQSHLFFHQRRDPLGWNAVSVAHPWESGLDNSPVWDEPLSRIDPRDAPDFKRVDKERVENAEATRPSDDTYRRYAALVKHIAEDDFGHGPFRVYDPMMTAILIRAEMDLAWLGAELGVETGAGSRARALSDGLVANLWDEEDERFCYRDGHTGEFIREEVLAACLPVILPLGDEIIEPVRRRLLSTFRSRWRLPTVPPTDPKFASKLYWRGPVWVNMNWFFAEALQSEFDLRGHTLELIGQSGFWEYFDPETGEGLGTDQFSWTAALVLDFLAVE